MLRPRLGAIQVSCADAFVPELRQLIGHVLAANLASKLSIDGLFVGEKAVVAIVIGVIIHDNATFKRVHRLNLLCMYLALIFEEQVSQ
jgi:hypothetical protein